MQDCVALALVELGDGDTFDLRMDHERVHRLALPGRRARTHWAYHRFLARLGAKYVPERWVEDDAT